MSLRISSSLLVGHAARIGNPRQVAKAGFGIATVVGRNEPAVQYDIRNCNARRYVGSFAITLSPPTTTFIVGSSSWMDATTTTTIPKTTAKISMTRRWKNKRSKMGQHLQKLDEMAHAGERETAEERRNKKKDKKTGKKNKGTNDNDDEERTRSTDEKDLDEDDEESQDHEMEQDDDSILPDSAVVKDRMLKQVQKFQEFLKGVRGSEPTPEMFESIAVHDAYGKGTGSAPMKAVAQVVIQSPTLAVATCFDPSTTKAVIQAIREKLELNPQLLNDNDGTINIPLPRVSMETRKALAQSVQKRAEMFRKRIRETRNKAVAIAKKGIAGQLEHVSKDDAFRVQQDIEKVKDEALSALNALVDAKSDDIMAVK